MLISAKNALNQNSGTMNSAIVKSTYANGSEWESDPSGRQSVRSLQRWAEMLNSPVRWPTEELARATEYWTIRAHRRPPWNPTNVHWRQYSHMTIKHLPLDLQMQLYASDDIAIVRCLMINIHVDRLAVSVSQSLQTRPQQMQAKFHHNQRRVHKHVNSQVSSARENCVANLECVHEAERQQWFLFVERC